MAAPALTFTGQRIYDAVAPLAQVDDENAYALARFCSAIAKLLDQAVDVSRDQDDGTPGYGQLFDVDNVDSEYLPYIARFVGVRLPAGLTDEAKRLRIKQTDGFRRGTPNAIINAARQHLVGPDGTGATASVDLRQRDGGPYSYTVVTKLSETPDEPAVLAALLEQKPAGFLLTLTVISGGDYETLLVTHTDYADVLATFTNYADVLSDPSQT
jgi:hypothetical protein